MKSLSIVLVDDHRVVTRSLKAYLESFADLKVTGIADSGEQLLEHLDEWQPDVILQDLLLPGGIDGIETIRRVRAKIPAAKIIALTASLDESRFLGVLRAGAAGYIRKDSEPETLLAAVRTVARGGTFIDPAMTRSSGRQDDLTSREHEVLRHLLWGRANKEIAYVLGIGEETVKTHVAHIMAKLDAASRSQVIVQALKRGLVSIEDIG